MHDHYAVFLDIDGTVYCHGEIVPKNRAAIRLAQQAGHKICINTARSPADIPEKIRNADWDAVVSSIGCNVVVGNRTLLNARIPTQEMARLFDELTAAGYPLMIEGTTVLLCNHLFAHDGHCISVQNGAELCENYADEPLAKVFLPGVLPQETQADLDRRYKFFQHRNYAEFSVKGHDKASGMLLALRAFGTDVSHCIAMGDSVNDLDMLRCAGISVAMGDADARVKQICTHVVCNAEDGGVAQALHTLLQL